MSVMFSQRAKMFSDFLADRHNDFR